MLLNGVNHVSLLTRDTSRVVASYRESRHPAARRGLRRPAAGDVRRSSIKRVASAVGEGSIAIRLVQEHLADRRPVAVGAGETESGSSP